MANETRQEALEAAVQALRLQYAARLSGELDDVRRCLAELVRAPQDPVLVDEARRHLHRLKGSAGTFGFLHVSRVAASLEKHVVVLAQRGRTLADDALDAVRCAPEDFAIAQKEDEAAEAKEKAPSP